MKVKMLLVTLFAAAVLPVTVQAQSFLTLETPSDVSKVTIVGWKNTGIKFGDAPNFLVNCTWDLVATNEKNRFVTIERRDTTGSLFSAGGCPQPN